LSIQPSEYLLCAYQPAFKCEKLESKALTLCIQDHKLERAVEVLGEVLQRKIGIYGGKDCVSTIDGDAIGNDARKDGLHVLALNTSSVADLSLESAPCYHRYGEALFYKAQDESDVFGAPIQQAAKEMDEHGQAEQNHSDEDTEKAERATRSCPE
jgi:ferredoxin